MTFEDEDEPIKTLHLIQELKPAWKCTCHNICKGGQFYSASRKKN